MKVFVISATVITLILVAEFMLIAFAWVGAEYVIEGVVHYGTVDRIITALLALYFLKRLMRVELAHKDNGQDA